jgi:HlyD family secretion protein
MPRTLRIAALLLSLAACQNAQPDAYGNFEAVEVVVSAEVGGQLERFDTAEGERLAAGVVVGSIDTTTAALQRQELLTQRGASAERGSQASAQTGVLEAQLATAERELARTQRLYTAEAATARQLDQAEGQVRVLREQIRAARAAAGAVREESAGAEARIAQLEEQIRRSRIVNPSAGTVLTTYAEPGEFVQPGRPLYKIADLDTLTLRVYVSGRQLAGLRLGEPVPVHVDSPEGGELALAGRIEWIASQAEFTPTPIQTRDERTTQVYAVKIRVPNPAGTAKIGMPADVVFGGSAGAP